MGKIWDKVMEAIFVSLLPAKMMNYIDVAKLSNSDVSTIILKEKVNKMAHKFEVSIKAFIKLKSAKVSDSIVKKILMNFSQGIASKDVAKTM